MPLQVYERNERAIDRAAKGNRPDIYNLHKGQTTLRVMGPYSEEGVWFRKIWEHYIQIGDDRYIFCCENPDGGECAVCDLGVEFIKEESEKVVELGKELKPRLRVLLNTIVLSDPQGGSPSSGIQVTEVPNSVFKGMNEYDRDIAAGYGDITSLEAGFNIIISKEGAGLATTYSVKATRDRSSIVDDLSKQGIDINNFSLFNLDQVKSPRDPSEIEVIASTISEFASHLEAESPSARALPVVDAEGEGEVSTSNAAEVPEIPPAPSRA